MTLRKIVRWLFSGLSAVFAMILAPNIEKLLAAKGWDTFLVKPSDGPLTQLTALASRPAVSLSIAVVVGVTAGLWLDTLLARFDARRVTKNKRWQALGVNMVHLAQWARNRRTSHFRQDSTDIFAEINVLRVQLHRESFPFPEAPRDATANHLLWIVERYAFAVGRLLQNELIDEARETAEHLADHLPRETYEEDTGRI